MATRFYLPESLAGQVTPPAPSGTDWEHINTVPPVRFLLRRPDNSNLTTTTYTPDAADHIVDGDACVRQYVSESLAAQTITGNIKAQQQFFEANTNNNLFFTLKVLVCNSTGSSTVGTLLAITRDTTDEFASAYTNRNFPSTALTSTAVSAGDRLVIELGWGGLPTAAAGTQGHNATVRFGCNASSGDLPENDTETGTTFRPWIEISTDLRFLGDEARPAITQQALTSGMIGLLRK